MSKELREYARDVAGDIDINDTDADDDGFNADDDGADEDIDIDDANEDDVDLNSEDDELFLEQVIFVSEVLGPLFLHDPSKGSLDDLLAAFATANVEEMAASWPFVDESLAADCLANMVEGLQEGPHAEALMWEYRRMFVGPKHMPVPPWGTVYTDREQVLFGPANVALHTWMNRNGVQRLAQDHMPDDHIGLLISLLGWVANNRPSVLDEFLREHVLTWSSHYFDLFIEMCEHPFYRGMAGLAKASLEGMAAERDIQVIEPRFYR